jgi:hypothetical protein
MNASAHRNGPPGQPWENLARLAAVREDIDGLLEQVAELRALRLRQLAATRSSSRSGYGAARVPAQPSSAT